MNKKLLLWEAIATLVGTIIGAGILGIPYVIAKAGFWTGIFDIVLPLIDNCQSSGCSITT